MIYSATYATAYATEQAEASQINARYRLGINGYETAPLSEQLPSQTKGAFVIADVDYRYALNPQSEFFVHLKGFAATEELDLILEEIDDNQAAFETGASSNAYVELRELWFKYSGLTDNEDEYLKLGLQRLSSANPLWWHHHLEALSWQRQTLRSKLLVAIGQKFARYRSNRDLLATDKEKLRVFAEFSYEFFAYHALALRATYAKQSSFQPEFQAGFQQGNDFNQFLPLSTEGNWLWYGIDLSHQWTLPLFSHGWAYQLSLMGLQGESEAFTQTSIQQEKMDLSSWFVDLGLRYTFATYPLSLGMTFFTADKGLEEQQSNFFLQTGVHANRYRYVGNGQFMYRVGQALRPELTNLTASSLFAAYDFADNYQLAASIYYANRLDPQLPIYRGQRAIALDQESKKLGYGMDLNLKKKFDSRQQAFNLAYVRFIASFFDNGEAFIDDGQVQYSVTLEISGRF